MKLSLSNAEIPTDRKSLNAVEIPGILGMGSHVLALHTNLHEGGLFCRKMLRFAPQTPSIQVTSNVLLTDSLLVGEAGTFSISPMFDWPLETGTRRAEDA